MAIYGSVTGRLGSAPEAGTPTKSGSARTKFSVATDHGWGESKTTTWVRVSVVGKEAEWALTGLAKGDSVVVFGELYGNDWTDKQGAKRTDVCCDAVKIEKQYAPKAEGQREERGNDGGYGGGGGGYGRGRVAPTPSSFGDEAPPYQDDDVPFVRLTAPAFGRLTH